MGMLNKSLINIEFIGCPFILDDTTIKSHRDWVSAVSGSSSKKTIIISGCYDGYLRVFRPGIKSCLFQRKAHSGPVTDLSLYENNSDIYAVSVSKDCNAQLWKVAPENGCCQALGKMVTA